MFILRESREPRERIKEAVDEGEETRIERSTQQGSQKDNDDTEAGCHREVERGSKGGKEGARKRGLSSTLNSLD
ncbi:unnamed protein product [Calypogeia fissa]